MIALGVGTGGAVSGVADAVVAGERVHRRRREHVGNESRVLVQTDAAAVADCDPGRFLPTMLQCEQPEENGLGDAFAVGSGDAEHAALLVWRRRNRCWLRTSLASDQAACPRTSLIRSSTG